jgi:2-polyprenyl-3-methyl-5-hydroxy-6-metoxy-1,4-benzoquinol methylase
MTGLREPKPDGFWDLAYRRGDHLEHWESPEVPSELVEAVASGLVLRGQTALDIGCGAGAEAVFLAKQGITVIGVDSSRVGIELARLRAEEENVIVDWREGDAARLPVRDNAIDFALDRGCFHVIARPQHSRDLAGVETSPPPGDV